MMTKFSIEKLTRRSFLKAGAALSSLAALPLPTYATPISLPPSAVEKTPGYSDIVVNRDTGEILRATAPNQIHFPASLTKMMTEYVAFERIEGGHFSPDDVVKISTNAANKTRSDKKAIGFRAGDQVKVGDLLLAAAIKSDNTAATALAEYISGSEEAFALKMTETARYLGMRQTTFKNATGLPRIETEKCTGVVQVVAESVERRTEQFWENAQSLVSRHHLKRDLYAGPHTDPEHVTTARDMAIIGMALQRHYPELSQIFSKANFEYKTLQRIGTGRHMRRISKISVYQTHNKLLVKHEGIPEIDGGKSGWTCDSRANLETWASSGNTHLVGVVLGAPSPQICADQMKHVLSQTLIQQKLGSKLLPLGLKLNDPISANSFINLPPKRSQASPAAASVASSQDGADAQEKLDSRDKLADPFPTAPEIPPVATSTSTLVPK